MPFTDELVHLRKDACGIDHQAVASRNARRDAECRTDQRDDLDPLTYTRVGRHWCTAPGISATMDKSAA